MTHSYEPCLIFVSHCLTSLYFYGGHLTHSQEPWLIYWDMNNPYESFIWAMPFLWRSFDSSIRAMTRLVWHDSSIWVIYMMTHLYATWLIHVWHNGFIWNMTPSWETRLACECVYMCKCVCVCVCTCACVHLCVYACECVKESVCPCSFEYVLRIPDCEMDNQERCTVVEAPLCVLCESVRVCVHVHACVCMCRLRCIFVYVCVCVHAYWVCDSVNVWMFWVPVYGVGVITASIFVHFWLSNGQTERFEHLVQHEPLLHLKVKHSHRHMRLSNWQATITAPSSTSSPVPWTILHTHGHGRTTISRPL